MTLSRETQRFRLRSKPEHFITDTTLECVTSDDYLPAELPDKHLLVRSLTMSSDPIMRVVIGELAIGGTPSSWSIAQVLESRAPRFKAGDIVLGVTPWATLCVVAADVFEPVFFPDISVSVVSSDNNNNSSDAYNGSGSGSGSGSAEVERDAVTYDSPSLYLGALGIVGATAYMGLIDIGRLQEKEAVFITSAAGGVGSIAGQIAKNVKNCYVVGSTGSSEKCAWMRKELGYDKALNYKTYKNNLVLFQAALRECFPNGIDVFFDNTGGFQTEAVWEVLNNGARVVVCGQVSTYNETAQDIAHSKTRDIAFLMTARNIRMQGFTVSSFEHWTQFNTQMRGWLASGRVRGHETIIQGFANIPTALQSFVDGENHGKMLVRIAEPDLALLTREKRVAPPDYGRVYDIFNRGYTAEFFSGAIHKIKGQIHINGGLYRAGDGAGAGAGAEDEENNNHNNNNNRNNAHDSDSKEEAPTPTPNAAAARGPAAIFFKNPFEEELIATAKAMAVRGKGILAADESTGTIGKRLAMINVENVEDNRRRYRELLFTTPNLGQYISGVILYEETLGQSTAGGTSFVEVLQKAGVIPGIKVDKGARALPYKPGEKYTQGLTGLDLRVKDYYTRGARFAKWRAVLQIHNGYISEASIKENAWTLANYAALCQAGGLVPIVEPEILMDGDHSIEVCQYWTEKVLAACYEALSDQEVILEGTLLKPNMVLAGKQYKGDRTAKRNGECTVQALLRGVPGAVGGINFLSGGQSEEEATINLNAINQHQNLPWSASFSYGRALQQSCLRAWKGEDSNVEAAQNALMERAKANSEAQLGKYTGDAASAESKKSLYEKGYVY